MFPQLKYKKVRKGVLKKFEFQSNKLKFGDIGLKAASSGIISDRQLEAARRAITRKLKRDGKVWLKVFPSVPVTRKASESRMGKGKGNVSFWAVPVFGGKVLFEICGIPTGVAIEALRAGGHKLPIKTKVVLR